MKIFNFNKSNPIKELTSDGYAYKVTWTRCFGEFSSEKSLTCKFFSDKNEADEFAEQLRLAHQLLGNSSSIITKVTVEKENHGGL